ncbi:UDP-N-acetylmuramoyl-L-alanine--D-glutamate ligase [soil metagenome]
MRKEELKNIKVTVLGGGRSGMAAAILLSRNGAIVFLSDENEKSNLPYLNENKLSESGIEFETGGHTDRIFDTQILVTSPGIKPDSTQLKRAKAENIKIISEVEAASWFCKAPIAGITGTNGKTTTTALTGEIFKNSGMKTGVCGNVGLAFSEVAEELDENSVAVLELSSYQLENIIDLKPKAAAILNLTQDHIEWHGSFENYAKAKFKINMNQDENDLFVLNEDDDELMRYSTDTKGIRAGITISGNPSKNIFDRGCYLKKDGLVYYDKNNEEEIIQKDKIKIKGEHNIYNSMAGIAIAKHFGIENDIISKTLQEFPGVEHRIEYAGVVDGVIFYNDSKSTNIDSLKVALKTFEKNVILMLGGKSSENKYSSLKDLVCGRVKNIIALGEEKERIYDSMSNFINVEKADSFEKSVNLAFKSANSGDIVLFSPACKSFDMFNNFEERGNEFKRIVSKLNR